jgi:hypothetical protein
MRSMGSPEVRHTHLTYMLEKLPHNQGVVSHSTFASFVLKEVYFVISINTRIS